MGFITKEVEVTVGCSSDKYFEGKGYIIPKHKRNGRWYADKGATIIVKVQDLTPSSPRRIEYACDCCGKPINIPYGDYVKYNRDGKYYCHSCSAKLFNSGENNLFYNPNLTDEERLKSVERWRNDGYYEFTQKVLKRDGYKCIVCGQAHTKEHSLIAHHLNGYSSDKENAVNPENGVTLCDDCHKKFHGIYGYGSNTKEQFEEWINYKELNLVCNFKLATLPKVILLNDGTIYASAPDAGRKLNINPNRIREVCQHKLYSVNDLHFMFLEEYENTPKEELKNAHTYQGYNTYGKNRTKVFCIQLNMKFDSMQEAGRYCKDNGYIDCENNSAGICLCCKKEASSSGKLPDGTLLQWVYYDEYLEKTKNGEEFVFYQNKEQRKKVICTTTSKTFNCAREGGEFYGINYKHIRKCCGGYQKYAGKLKDGTKLAWMLYEDFLKLPQEEQNEILAKNKESSNDGSF